MTDELVKRLRAWDGSPFDEEAHAAADRIEQLTAERDAAYANGYSDAETEISKSALGQRNDFLHSQYANAIDHIKVLTAERDRLREALFTWVDMMNDPSLKLRRKSVEFYNVAIAALKGESHE